MSKLGDFVKIQGGYSFKSSDFSDENTGIPVIKIANITGGSFIDLSKYQTVPTELLKKTSSFKTKVDDILIAMTGANVGKIARVPKDSPICLINQRVGRVLLKENCQYSSDFIYYLLASNKSYEYFAKVATGAAQPNISGGLIEDLDFPEIDVEQANNAGKILKTIDDKIQLNTQTNQTLEQIAQAIYKSWFVDYEPTRAKAAVLAAGGSMAEAETAAMTAISGKTAALAQNHPARYQQLADLAAAFPAALVPADDFGEIPEGWEISTIGESYSVVMGQSPSGETYNEEGQGTLFYQGRAEFGERFPRPRLYTTAPKRMAQKDDVLMSVRAPVGDLNVALEDCCIGRGLAALRHKSGSFSFGLYQIQSLKPALDLFNSEGTVFGSINQKDLKAINVLQPADMIISLFNGICLTIDKQIQNNTQQNILLSETRDIMLPKLLNGDIEA